MEETLLHPAHEHPLLRRDLWKDCTVQCSLCWSHFGGVAYCCLDCNFFLQESCASIEPPLQLQHPSHSEHPLALKFSFGRCLYRCGSCSFTLAPVIAIPTLPPAEQATEEILEIVRLLDHEHPLNSFQANTDLSESCRVCWEGIRPGTFYGCSQGCTFFLHEQCAHLPEEIQHHPFHPQHPLTFALSEGEFKCKACSYDIGSWNGYRCTECGIHFHALCAASALVSQDHKAEIEHFSHQHKLTSFRQQNSHSNLSCAVCMEDLSGESLCCLECRLFLHKSCMEELPRQIVHHAHSKHPLLLQQKPTSDGNCSGCDESSLPIMFGCESCDFCLHPACALRTISAVEKDKVAAEIQHPAHAHPLVLRLYSGLPCHACYERVDGLTYSCNECEFNIHRSCAELPLELQHPLHPPHPLLLNMSSAEPFSCNRCQNESDAFFFSCTECKFYLDITCATQERTFKHPRHEHYLTPFFGLTEDLCHSCGKSYGTGFKDLYRCLSCNFSLHGYCLLDLPNTVERECHPYHPLVLMNKFVDGLPEYQYCDYCEKIRNPEHGVYRCAECWYTVHIDCVVRPKVLVNPILGELDEKIDNMEKKIQVMRQELDESIEELSALKQERSSEAERMVHGLHIEGGREDDDDHNDAKDLRNGDYTDRRYYRLQ